MADISDLGFNASEVEPNTAFDVIPAGTYEAVIVASDKKQTNDGTGEYIKLELQIVSGEYQNRKLWDNLNLKNRSEQAVQIARGTLSSICRAVGVLTPRDTAELHMKKLRIKVGVEDRKDSVTKKPTGEKQNRIKGYEPIAVSPPAVMAGSSAASTPW